MQRQVEIINKLGLHARPAALFVQCVIRFQSTVSIHKDGERYSAASILEVLAANLDCGARITIEAVVPTRKKRLMNWKHCYGAFLKKKAKPARQNRSISSFAFII